MESQMVKKKMKDIDSYEGLRPGRSVSGMLIGAKDVGVVPKADGLSVLTGSHLQCIRTGKHVMLQTGT